MDIKKLGVWFFTDGMAAGESAEFAKRVESMGYPALWIPEALGRNSLVHAAWLLSQTESLVVATGIANVFARDAQASAAARWTLNEQSGGRFLLGLGVSHKPLVVQARGHDYSKPLTFMENYLQKLSEASYNAPKPAENGELVIAALGPKMLKLSATHSDGAHPYNVNPEHTRKAREAIGPYKKLYVEQKVLLESDADKARSIAAKTLDMYMKLPNYRNNWKRLGFTEQELENQAPRFLDAMVAWGSLDDIAERIEQHWEAGADHVCVQPLGGPTDHTPDLKVLEELAKRYF